MTTYEMKEAIKKEYPGMKWQQKVAKMSDRQIYCVYNSIERRKAAGLKTPEKDNGGRQMTLFDYDNFNKENGGN